MVVASNQYAFSGRETFPFRYPWLKKGFDAVRTGPGVFTRDDAITTLGVGKNMVRSIRHWCLAAGILAEGRDTGLQPTELGALLLDDDGLDPYLEDPATLWVLHRQIACNRKAPLPRPRGRGAFRIASYGETAGLRQLYRRERISPTEALTEAYTACSDRVATPAQRVQWAAAPHGAAERW